MFPARLLMLATLLLPAACAIEPAAPGAFYETALPAGARPGTLVRAEPFPSAPAGARAWRILYATEGLDGAPRSVSGLVIAPDTPAPAGGDRPVIAWAHPTTGIADRCAPSLRPQVFASIPGLDAFLAAGSVVVATDYPGLGTPGMHPYLVGTSEGRAVLDSVRAARALAAAGAGPRVALWGHSQGGHAALFAGALAPAYTPELQLVGIAAAAPATDLATTFDDDIGTGVGRVLAAYALTAWSEVYAVPLEGLMSPGAAAATRAVAADCLEDRLQALRLSLDARPLAEGFVRASLLHQQPWSGLLAANTPPPRLAAPLMLAQGGKDSIVPPSVSRAYAARACAAGTPVRWLDMPEEEHNPAGRASAPAVAAWIAGRFAGAPVPDDCSLLRRRAGR